MFRSALVAVVTTAAIGPVTFGQCPGTPAVVVTQPIVIWHSPAPAVECAPPVVAAPHPVGLPGLLTIAKTPLPKLPTLPPDIK